MSVTFYPTLQEALTRVACACAAVVAPTLYASAGEAYSASQDGSIAAQVVCGDELCAAYPLICLPVEVTPEVNVSNVNAVQILDVLGILVGESFSDRCSGIMSAEDFLGRVLIADAVQLEDAGVPAVQTGNLVECGREEGYLNARISELRPVAEYAAAHQLEICWG